jgi:ATP-binding cassette subfamily B protein
VEPKPLTPKKIGAIEELEFEKVSFSIRLRIIKL